MGAWLDGAPLLGVHVAMAWCVVEMALRWARRDTGHPRSAWRLLHPAAGLCLMGALREALTSGQPIWLLAWMTAAGAAHVADLIWGPR